MSDLFDSPHRYSGSGGGAYIGDDIDMELDFDQEIGETHSYGGEGDRAKSRRRRSKGDGGYGAAEYDYADDDLYCEATGIDLQTDLNGNHFYTSFQSDKCKFTVGDCVRVQMDSDTLDELGEDFSFAQVVCIYEDAQGYVHSEVRWFKKVGELDRDAYSAYVAQANNEFHKECVELIESVDMDDIPAGSIIETIQIEDFAGSKLAGASAKYDSAPTLKAKQSSFVLRFMHTPGGTLGKSIERTNPKNLLINSIKYSHYKHVFANPNAQDFISSITNIEVDWYSTIISRLHISVIPKELPCREKEMDDIETFICNQIRDGSGDALYISGLPGTGKTACVKAVVRRLMDKLKVRRDNHQIKPDKGGANISDDNNSNNNSDSNSNSKELAVFEDLNFDIQLDWIEINCIQLSKPDQAYSQLYRGIKGEHLSPSQALKQLASLFNPDSIRLPQQNYMTNSSGRQVKQFHVILIDEMDFLVTKRNSNILYNLLNWPMTPGSNLIVIGVANMLDLPNIVGKAVGSRASKGSGVVFTPYKHTEIATILQSRLCDIVDIGAPASTASNNSIRSGIVLARNNKTKSIVAASLINAKAIEFISRKAASISGDLRTALKICSKYIEMTKDYEYNRQLKEAIAKPNNGGSSEIFMVQSSIIKRIIDEHNMFTPLAFLRDSLSLLQKAIMITFCKHFKATGGDMDMTSEMIWSRLLDIHLWLQDTDRLATDGRPGSGCTLQLPPVEVVDLAIQSLVACELLIPLAPGHSRTAASSCHPSLHRKRKFGHASFVIVPPRSELYRSRLEYMEIIDTLKDDVMVAHVR